MILNELLSKKLIHPPSWLADNCVYLTLMGSVAYGVSSDTSDCDVYGIAIPQKSVLFPHLAGEIIGFGRNIQRFEQWQEHHIIDQDALAGKGRSYDFSVFGIVKFFQLCMDNNPNILDSIHTPINCVIHSTQVGNMIRENRRIFIHKGCFHKLLGYAHSQLHKMGTKTPVPGSNREKDVATHGFDTKYAYHLCRLSDECEQLLTTGDMDLQRSHEHMKAIRRGEVSEEEIRAWFTEREKTLEKVYAESKLPHSPDEGKIKTLLLQCLEHHYGSLDKLGFVRPDAAVTALRQIQEIIEKNKGLLA